MMLRTLAGRTISVMRVHRLQRAHEESGAVAVELAFVLPLVVVLLLGIIEMGRLMATYEGVVSASREGARYGTAIGAGSSGAPRYSDCSGMRAAAKQVAPGVTDAHITITYDHGPSSSTFLTCAGSSVPAAAVQPLDRVVVTVTRPFEFVTGLLPGVTLTGIDRRTLNTPDAP